MFRTIRYLLVALLTPLFFVDIVTAKGNVSDEQIKQSIIEQSISTYPGTCACPYNSTRNGRLCGGRSAWSRAGGYSPICYKKEVTPEMIKQWRDSH